MVRDLENAKSEAECLEDLFNDSFDDLEDATAEVESDEDPFNDSLDISALDDMDNENASSFQTSNILSPVDERCANFKRKSDIVLHKNSKKPNLNQIVINGGFVCSCIFLNI